MGAFLSLRLSFLEQAGSYNLLSLTQPGVHTEKLVLVPYPERLRLRTL